MIPKKDASAVSEDGLPPKNQAPVQSPLQYDAREGTPLSAEREVTEISEIQSRREQVQSSKILRIFRRFPATIIVAAPYAALILPVAVWNVNPQTIFIIQLLGIATLGCFLAELFLVPSRPSARAHRRPKVQRQLGKSFWNLTVSVIVISATARIVYAAGGGGTILAQVSGEGPQGTLTSIAGLFILWNVFSAGLLFASYLGGACGRNKLWLWLMVLIFVELSAAFLTTITAPFIQFLTPVILVGLLLGVIRARSVLIGFLIVICLWPLVFSLRNAERVDAGIAVSAEVTYSDRLRFDLQLTSVSPFLVPVDLGQPRLVDSLRYGLVPRVLDADRPPVSSGRLINQALGGSSTSSYNFLSIGTLYFFYGPWGLGAYYFVVSLIFSRCVRWSVQSGGAAICITLLTAHSLLGWASTYPDAIIGFFQGLVSFVPIAIALGFVRASKSLPST